MNALAEKFQSVFKKLRGFGKLTDANISESLREVRMALLAADVNYQTAKRFCDNIKERALGEEVSSSVRPGDLFVKIVHDELVSFLSAGGAGTLSPQRPLSVALCGLNGAGKTTSAAKLARLLAKQGAKPLLIAADLSRPAAADQLETLGRQLDIPVLRPNPGEDLPAYLRRISSDEAFHNADVRIHDLAGRLELDQALLDELKTAIGLIQPTETLLVADAATGQNAANVARAFQQAAPLTGIILSKFDGDARGGAALTLQELTGCPLKYLGTGEKTSDFEEFNPDRLVRRLLGMGDLYGLAQQVTETIDIEDASRLEQKLKSRSFDLQDFLDQFRQLKKLGPLQNLLGMMPGMTNIPPSALDENGLKRTEAIICSMTFLERRRPELINARRRQRIASGSGTTVTEVNQVLSRFRDMKKMMGKLARGGFNQNRLMKMLGNR